VLLQCKPQLKEWSLTNSEAVIAEALLLGMSLPEIAARRGRALSTVKSQAKAIYAKAGVKGQLDFIFKHRSSLRALKEAQADMTAFGYGGPRSSNIPLLGDAALRSHA
jgi:DNA-binding CsgD family transcriptional regulator